VTDSTSKSTSGGAAVGAAIGGYYGGGQGAAQGAQVGGSIGSMFGSNPYRRMKRDLRKQYEYARRYQPLTEKALFDSKMESFQKHGIHPLFGLGGPGAAGSSTAFSMAGQSPTGNHISDGMAALMDYMLRSKEIELKQTWLEKQKADSDRVIAENNISNDQAIDLVKDAHTIPKINPHAQEIKKGEVDTHMKNHREQKTGEKSPMFKFRYGGQDVWLPTEEISEFFDNIATMAPMAASYHGNKGVDWDRLFYYHRNGTIKGYDKRSKVSRAINFLKKELRRSKDRGTERREKFEKRYQQENKRIQFLRNRGAG
jgi:hypothetical protein